MNQEKVLIVEDEENERTGLAENWGLGLRDRNRRRRRRRLGEGRALESGIVVTDLRMPRMDGMAVARADRHASRSRSP